MIATHIATFVVGAFLVLVVQQLRIDKLVAEHEAEISSLISKHQAAVIADNTVNRKKQEFLTQNYEGALNDARIRETSLRMDLGRARAAADSLREQSKIAAYRIKLPETPPASIAEYALAAGELLDQCSRKYRWMAAKADEHAADARLMQEAWPVLPDATP